MPAQNPETTAATIKIVRTCKGLGSIIKGVAKAAGKVTKLGQKTAVGVGGLGVGVGGGKMLDDARKEAKKKVSMKTEHYDWRETLDEKCWKGYEKKGMKTMFGKRYPNCVKKSKKKK